MAAGSAGKEVSPSRRLRSKRNTLIAEIDEICASCPNAVIWAISDFP
jgi:hypothetical protein